MDPGKSQQLAAHAQRAFRAGDMTSAREAFRQLTEAHPSDPQHWIHLALACQKLGDEAGEEDAITHALTLDPMELLALILRANLLERRGLRHQAALAFGAVISVSPPLDRVHPELRAAVAHAWEVRQKYDRECGAFLDHFLESRLGGLEGKDIRRFRDSLDIMVGRKRRFDSQSAMFHYPHLEAWEFFDRDRFPWLDGVEAATDAIRGEFLEVLKSDQGFAPYISYAADMPHNQWVELNNSPRWSAFHLFKMGQRVEANAARCPRTLEALGAAPQPDQPGRTPAAMFSLLKPRTRIPPHCGVSNTRLVVHLPLIVPEGCGFRVGNESRQWVPGKAWVFDDTIEHEAWNESDKLRVVLIFDIWHPDLSATERELITRLTAGLNAFTGGETPFEL
jgi:aspartate beta-hydroxylase